MRPKTYRKRKKIRIGLFLGALLFILLAIGVFILFRPQKLAGNVPVKVGTDATIALQKVNNSGVAFTDDAGAPEFVTLKSSGTQSNHVDDLSDLTGGNFIIYRIHNAKVLKTATKPIPQQEYLSDLAVRYPSAIIMNTSGFNLTSGKLRGLQINNGQLISGWDARDFPTSAFVVYKDGKTGVIENTQPAAEIMKSQVVQSHSWGAVLVKNGKLQPDDGSINWEYHSFIGTDKNNNLILMISKYYSYATVEELYQSLNLESLVTMDGGNSSQIWVSGTNVFQDSADRALPDCIVAE
ncbi:MAG: phosphodiester glycosidase family protein [Streptococcaceae bacterium]|jgi:exopolysaccharide biosynthesis protein|nr:phosphodiester glycosidase family protein [Streptococcaceae bacterium]